MFKAYWINKLGPRPLNFVAVEPIKHQKRTVCKLSNEAHCSPGLPPGYQCNGRCCLVKNDYVDCHFYNSSHTEQSNTALNMVMDE